jgi:hypothetical protein
VFIKYGRDLLTKAGIDYKSSGSSGSGYLFSFAADQALRIAASMDGGLNRSNIIVALRAMEVTHPLFLDGIKFNMNGNKDAYLVEGSDIAKYNAGTQGWDQQGDIIVLSGKSSNCVWDQTIGNCS